MPTTIADITHASSQEESLLKDLFTSYYSRLTLFAFRYLHDKQLSEDIVQDCFVRIWERRAIVSLQSISLSYLYGAVKKKCWYFLREKKIIRELKDEEIVLEQDDISKFVEAETYGQLFQAIEMLPPRCRNIFLLLYKEGKSFREIAEELNITESTIRTQKAKGLQLIRQKLQWFLVFIFMIKNLL